MVFLLRAACDYKISCYPHPLLDDKIPFIEYFIVPYMLWFAFITVTIGYFFFCNTNEFYRLCLFLFTGMTIFLIVSTLYPNGQLLRPDTFARENIFVDMVRTLYATDTPTNILPSIHVYNSLGAYIAISHNQKLRENTLIHYGSLALTVLIILSTNVLKTALCYRCTSRRCDGRCDVCSRIYEGTQ